MDNQAWHALGERLRDRILYVVGRISERLALEIAPARGLTQTELEDHLITFLSDLFLLVMATGESERARRGNERDSAAIQRMIGELHGRQRRERGWTPEQLEREYRIAEEEIEAVIRRVVGDETKTRETIELLRPLIAQSREAALHGYRLAGTDAEHAIESETVPAAARDGFRQFTDSAGVEWTVREIRPGPMPPKLMNMLGGERRRGGWLLFLSAGGEKRRLSPIPPGWGELSRFEMERWCVRASRVPPAPGRRIEDRSPPAV